MHKDIQLRVYKRSEQDIVLIWSIAGLTEEQSKDIHISILGQEIKYAARLRGNEIVCVIDHAANRLDKSKDYVIKLHLGGDKTEAITRSIDVLKFGLLPNTEKDRKDARVHLMGWDPGANAWARINLVKLSDGSYALPMIVVDRNGEPCDR